MAHAGLWQPDGKVDEVCVFTTCLSTLLVTSVPTVSSWMTGAIGPQPEMLAPEL